MAPFSGWLVSKNQLRKRLIVWKKDEVDDEFAEKAIDFLIRKLLVQKGSMEILENALRSPNVQTKCVTVPIGADGKVQISHRKKLPHLIYCSIWRWPDLTSPYQLKNINCCEFPYEPKSRQVCINPYHYQRVVARDLPAILVRKQSMSDRDDESMIYQEHQEEKIPQNVGISSFNIPQNDAYDSSKLDQEISNEAQNFYFMNQNEQQLVDQQFIDNSSGEIAQVCYQEQYHWASVAYYELNNRVGDIFHCQFHSVVIDGFTNPSNNYDRFCLGPLSNVRRNSSIENTRKLIGKGILMIYTGNEVFIECWSDYPIFIQSRNCNNYHGFNSNTVCKISTGQSLKIFDNHQFAQLLSTSVNHGFEAVYDLTKMCTIRISFAKGWGADYHRQDVTSTPCWIEIHLHGPLQWLDGVLTQMGPPLNRISSVS